MGNPSGSCHSVGAMFLVRDLVSARSWLAMISHLVGLFTGLAVIFIVTFGLRPRRGPGRCSRWSACRILGLTLRAADWFARAERARLAFMLGARIPAWPAEGRAGYRWGIVPRLADFYRAGDLGGYRVRAAGG